MRASLIIIAVAVWFVPPPEGLTIQAWRLFDIFAAAIVSVVVGAFPILTASVLCVAAAVLTGLLSPANAYAGFANGTILLIVVAFLVARSVVKCGLGARIGKSSWRVPPLFRLIEKGGGISEDEMFRTFNMGIGMVVVVAPGDLHEVEQRRRLREPGDRAPGRVVRCENHTVAVKTSRYEFITRPTRTQDLPIKATNSYIA